MKHKRKADDRFSIRIPPDMRDDLEAIAKREARSIANVMKLAIGKFLSQIKPDESLGADRKSIEGEKHGRKENERGDRQIAK